MAAVTVVPERLLTISDDMGNNLVLIAYDHGLCARGFCMVSRRGSKNVETLAQFRTFKQTRRVADIAAKLEQGGDGWVLWIKDFWEFLSIITEQNDVNLKVVRKRIEHIRKSKGVV